MIEVWHKPEEQPSDFQHGMAVGMGITLPHMVQDVAEFRDATGNDNPTGPEWPSHKVQQKHKSLIDEEHTEVTEEISDTVDHTSDRYARLAGELIDLIYVAIDAMLAYGMPIKDCWAAKHAANMAKVDPVTKQVRRREDGKILKPEGWQPADMHKVIFS